MPPLCCGFSAHTRTARSAGADAHPEPAILAQREALLGELRGFLAADQVIADGAGLRAYDSDAFTAYRQQPLVAVLPNDVAELSQVLALCHRRHIKVVARGAGLRSRVARCRSPTRC